MFHRAGELVRRPQHDGEEPGGDDRVKRDERAHDFEQLFGNGFGLEIQSRIVLASDSPDSLLTNLFPTETERSVPLRLTEPHQTNASVRAERARQ